MFGLKFKRKNDSATSTSTTTPPSSSSSASTTTAPATDGTTNSNLAGPKTETSGDVNSTNHFYFQQPVSTTSSSSANLIGRSNSDGNRHGHSNESNMHNNGDINANPFLPQRSSATAPSSPAQHQSPIPDLSDIYKVPFESLMQSITTNIKVPVPDTASSNNSSAYTTAPSSLGSVIATTMNGYPNHPVQESDRRSSQGPKTNLATKPAAGTFASTTTDMVNSSVSDCTSNNGSNGAHNATATTGSVPPSATSSATPSRSSSTSNRGGVAVSTGSFTPLSATPPMTPRLAHEIADLHSGSNGPSGVDGASTIGEQQQQHLTRALQQHHHHQMMTPIATVILPGTTHSGTTVGASTTLGESNNNHAQATTTTAAFTSGAAFVSSPITYQPPLSHATFPQDSFQNIYVPLSLMEDNPISPIMSQFPHHHLQGAAASVTAATGTDSLTRTNNNSNNKPTPTRETTLMQQQQYQQQQMAQFREDMSGCPNETGQQQQQQQDVSKIFQRDSNHGSEAAPLTSAAAVAATLARTNASPPVPTSEDQLLVRDRTASQAGSMYTGGHESPGHGSVPSSTATSPTSATGQYPRMGITAADHDSQQQQQQQNHHQPHHNQGSMANSMNPMGGSSIFFPSPITRASTNLAASHLITHDVRQSSGYSHIEDGAGPVVLMAIGKTGQGKSSLLNKIMGTSELKASASVRAVTKGIAERTGWGRFEDSRRVLVTLADTPGLADTEGDDEKNIPILKEYIKSVGTRLGVTAFLLVFKIDSGVDMIITILQTFNDIMKDFPNFWDNVILVFTGCDYRRNVMNTKQLYHEEIQSQLQQHFFKDRTPSPTTATSSTTPSSSSSDPSPTLATDPLADPIVQMVFLSCAEAPCGFALGEKCDCKARTTFLNAGIKRLWYAVRSKKRWVLDSEQDDDLLGHS
ncbi:hypothetical protein BGZ83_001318 [Gryganskiella cystojenkinii]|nr:hypothetical protein BGZ83_001318 [Gryganskiella cystojenkinii]